MQLDDGSARLWAGAAPLPRPEWAAPDRGARSLARLDRLPAIEIKAVLPWRPWRRLAAFFLRAAR